MLHIIVLQTEKSRSAAKLAQENGLYAFHGSEVEPALGSGGIIFKAYEEAEDPARMQAMRRKLHGAWVNFAKTGQPDAALAVKWVPYTSEHHSTYLINDTCCNVLALREGVNQFCAQFRIYETEDYDAMKAHILSLPEYCSGATGSS